MTTLDTLVLLFGCEIALWGVFCAVMPVTAERVIAVIFETVVRMAGLG